MSEKIFEDGVKCGIEMVLNILKENVYHQDNRIVTKYYNWTIDDFINDLKDKTYGDFNKRIK